MLELVSAGTSRRAESQSECMLQRELLPRKNGDIAKPQRIHALSRHFPERERWQ